MHFIIMSRYAWQGAVSPPVFLTHSWNSCVSFMHCIGAGAPALERAHRHTSASSLAECHITH